MRGPRLLLLITMVVLLTAARAWADGPAGSDPTQNFPLGVMPAVCSSQPDGAACQNAAIYYLDQARASLGEPRYELPTDFTSLAPVDQDLILTNLDRTLYGLPAVPGLTTELDDDAATGVTNDADPLTSDPDIATGRSNWAGAYPNIESAYEAWMYDDGPGSGNIECTPSDMSGCWGHRHGILWSFNESGALAMGAAAGLDSSGAAGYAMLIIVGGSSYSPAYTDTWATAQADGAGSVGYSPGTPQMTVDIDIDGQGTVSDSQGQVCTDAVCSFLEPLDQPVAFTATPQTGSALAEWFNACSGTDTCTVIPKQTYTEVGAFFTSDVGSGSPGLGGSSGSGGTAGSGAKTGAPSTSTAAHILRLTATRGTIHATLHGSHLVCTLSRRDHRRWTRGRVSRCRASVTYRRLPAGRYRLTVRSGAASTVRVITLRRGPARSTRPVSQR